ncbi:MAG TPA: hypothetical protein VFK06_25915 [Candidatus Angelobacter sp.]|nr:hypothetical protein [Candidatus Angelobacter sp.]
MPIFYRIDKQRKLVITTACGPFSASDIQQVRAHLLRDPEFDISFSELADLTQVAHTDITGDQMRLLVLSGAFSQESRRAFIAREEVLRGIARMIEIHCNFRGDERISVFSERHEALAWLQQKYG